MDYLRDKFYPEGSECPKCGKASKFHPVKGRSAYACQYCRGQVYPTAGTIFHKSCTSLQLWFWSVYLMSSTRCGISAKQLEREIGVSYPTAHRMFKQIRSLLSDEDEGQLSGEVEIDETFVGGKPRKADQIKTMSDRRRYAAKKSTVFGMVERGGRIRARVVPDRGNSTLHEVRTHVLSDSVIFSDNGAPIATCTRLIEATIASDTAPRFTYRATSTQTRLRDSSDS
ncbi:MAG: IS1595 family transposase [Actinomycetota bacterium]|nr:IS1595 family transposase [Actinomycetota bacterium]